MATTIYTNPRDIGVDGNQVTISPAAYERLTQAEAACYEILSARQHDRNLRLPKLAHDELERWARLAFDKEAGHGD